MPRRRVALCSAVSLLPGGVGANEAGMVGLLVVVGVEPGAAAAIAVLMRFVASVLAVRLPPTQPPGAVSRA